MAWHCFKIIWWCLLAIVPLIVQRLSRKMLVEIGCPPGDCYLPGAGAASDLVTVAFLLCIFLWPICLWHVAGLSYQLVRTIRDQKHGSSSP